MGTPTILLILYIYAGHGIAADSIEFSSASGCIAAAWEMRAKIDDLALNTRALSSAMPVQMIYKCVGK